MQHNPFYHLRWGIFFILLSWLFITLMATVSRMAAPAVPLPTIVFFQNFISWLTVLPWLFFHGVRSLKTQRFGLIFVRGFCGMFGFAFLFLAVRYTSLVDAILLNNTAPLFVPFALLIWRKIPINHKLWPGIFIGFLGIIFILKPGKEILNPGALFALGAAFSLTFAMIAMRLLSYTERTHTVLFYYFLIASLLPLPFTLYYWEPLHEIQWAQLLLIGLFAAFAQWAFMRAFHHAKPSQLGPFCYTAVVFSGLIEWILWGQIPDLFAWIGILLVAGGGILTIRYSTTQPG